MKKVFIILLVLSIAVTAYAIITGAGVKYVIPIHSQVNTVGLIARYKLWNNTMFGDLVFDYSLDGKVGTVTDADAPAAPTLIPTYPGFNFDGTNDHIVIADNAKFTPNLVPFSISAWIYMRDAKDFAIVSKGLYNTDGEWQLQTNDYGYLKFYLYDESKDSCFILRRHNVDYRVAHENKWLHIGATYDGTNNFTGMRLYVDGADIIGGGWNKNTFGNVDDGNHAVWIGRYDPNYANGIIDDVMFFDKELTAIEVRNIYEVTRWRYQK